MDKKRTILVVEDDAALLHVIRWKLESAGFDVQLSKTAEGALLRMKETKIDLLWLDHYLPGDMTGMELVSKLKADQELSSIPVFVVSNAGWNDRVLSYKDVGITKYYVKSNMTLDQIIKDIQEQLRIDNG